MEKDGELIASKGVCGMNTVRAASCTCKLYCIKTQ